MAYNDVIEPYERYIRKLEATNADLLAALEVATVPVANPSQHYCEDWDEWFHGVRAAAIAKAKDGKG